jgi:Fe-S-cluster containining protein
MKDCPSHKQHPVPAIVIPQLDDYHSKPLMAKVVGLFRQIGCARGVKRFRQNLSLPKEAQQLSQKAFRLYDEYLVYVLRGLQKRGWRVYCASGCASCCFNMPVGISNLEFLLIYTYLQQIGQLERFFRKNLESCQVLARVEAQANAEGNKDQSEDKGRLEALLHEYSRARHPCAFLTERQECLIYPVRPLACRIHFAFTPPELCDPNHPRFSDAVRINIGPYAPVEEELKRIDSYLSLGISDLLAPGLVGLTANVMRFSPILWS